MPQCNDNMTVRKSGKRWPALRGSREEVSINTSSLVELLLNEFAGKTVRIKRLHNVTT